MEEYCESYRTNCLQAEDKALQFLTNIDLPVVNVPTLRDLSCTRDFLSLLGLGKSFKSIQEYTLFLVSVTDVVTCACRHPTFFTLVEKKNDVTKGFPRLLSDLNSQWERLLGNLSPKYVSSKQLSSVINLLTNALNRLEGYQKAYFYGTLKKSQQCLMFVEQGSFKIDQPQTNIQKEHVINDDDHINCKVPKKVTDITKYLLPKPVQQPIAPAPSAGITSDCRASTHAAEMPTKENVTQVDSEVVPLPKTSKPRLTLVPIGRLLGRDNLPVSAATNPAPVSTKPLLGDKQHDKSSIETNAPESKQSKRELNKLSNESVVDLCSPVKRAATDVVAPIAKKNAFQMMMFRSRENAKLKKALALESKK